MSAALVLEQVRTAGLELSATQEGKLRWCSRGPLPGVLRERLAEHKAELVELLADEAFALAGLQSHWGLLPGFLRLYSPEEFRAKFLMANESD